MRIRKFHKKEGDFFAISKRLASDPNLGLCTYQDRQKAPYDYKDFYTVSTDKECDIFRCEENGLLYTQACLRTSLFCFLLYQLSLWWVKYRAQPEAIST